MDRAAVGEAAGRWKGMRVAETKAMNARVPQAAIAGSRVIRKLRPVPFYLVVDFDPHGGRTEREIDDVDIRRRRETRTIKKDRPKRAHNAPAGR